MRLWSERVVAEGASFATNTTIGLIRSGNRTQSSRDYTATQPMTGRSKPILQSPPCRSLAKLQLSNCPSTGTSAIVSRMLPCSGRIPSARSVAFGESFFVSAETGSGCAVRQIPLPSKYPSTTNPHTQFHRKIAETKTDTPRSIGKEAACRFQNRILQRVRCCSLLMPYCSMPLSPGELRYSCYLLRDKVAVLHGSCAIGIKNGLKMIEEQGVVLPE